MMKQVIFFHGGGGQEDFDADAKLVDSLRSTLGQSYSVHYPLLVNEDVPDFGRRKQIDHEITESADNVILVAHSLGASMILACLSEDPPAKKIAGIFLISTPFWSGSEDWVEPLKLRDDFDQRLSKTIPLFFYHCRDDEEVPFGQFNIYREKLPWATFREIAVGGHQLNNDLSVVARDMKAIAGG